MSDTGFYCKSCGHTLNYRQSLNARQREEENEVTQRFDRIGLSTGVALAGIVAGWWLAANVWWWSLGIDSRQRYVVFHWVMSTTAESPFFAWIVGGLLLWLSIKIGRMVTGRRLMAVRQEYDRLRSIDNDLRDWLREHPDANKKEQIAAERQIEDKHRRSG